MDKLVLSVEIFEKAYHDMNSTPKHIREASQNKIDSYYALYGAIKQYKEQK